MRDMALVNAATLIAEPGDLSRFANPRQLMAYLGLVPSEHSSGASVKRGGITKAGNTAARRLLIEAAWSYRFPGCCARSASPSRSATSPGRGKCGCARAIAGSPAQATIVTTAIARELSDFVWPSPGR
jgi:transposase